MLNLLRARYARPEHGNGQRYVVAEHVRSHAGFDARRTADFIAMDLWPSKGLALHGHEVKVSRSDWLRELEHPEKAGEFIPYLHYWWIVVAHPAMVKRTELPAGWGLIALQDGRLRTVAPARRNRTPLPLPPSRMAALLRAAVKTAERDAEAHYNRQSQAQRGR